MKYISVTSLAKRYSQPFDADAVAEKVAERQGTDKTSILADWEIKRKKASAKGTLIHQVIEADLRGGALPTIPIECKPAIEQWRKYRADNDKSGVVFNENSIALEYKFTNEYYGVKGTVDFISAPDGDSRAVIVDWKTVGNFTTKNDYGEKMLSPFQNYDACKLNEYALQVALYARLLQQSDNPIIRGRKLEIGVVQFNDDSYAVHNVGFMQGRLIEKILSDRRKEIS